MKVTNVIQKFFRWIFLQEYLANVAFCEGEVRHSAMKDLFFLSEVASEKESSLVYLVGNFTSTCIRDDIWKFLL